MKNTEQLREDAKAASELLTRTTRLEDVERVIKKGCVDLALDIPQLRNTVVVNHELLVQALIQWVNTERAALRELGVEVSRDNHYPHVTYAGQQSSTDGTKVTEVEFPAGLVPVVSESLAVVKAHNGSWTLRKDGTLVMTVTNRVGEPFAVIGGQVFMDEAELQKHYMRFDVSPVSADGHSSAAYTVKTSTDKAGQLYATGFGSTLEDYQWNKPEDLPPVGCDLLIKVPAGTEVAMVKSEAMEMGYTTDLERVFKVFRTSHLADRAGAMEYRLPDNSTVTGRFPWTYP